MAWLRSAQAEVKRDMEMARDEVRVMTVHGAKGLEAPIVILADTTTPPQGFHPPRLLQLSANHAGPGAPLVWGTAKANDVGPMAAARETALNEARDEYRRLLYVAMTRAIERLVVCGVDGLIKRPDGCWYDLVRGALEAHCVTEPSDIGDGEVLRYRKVPDAPPIQPPKPVALQLPLLPPWLSRPAPETRRANPIKPSGFVEDPVTAGLTGPREARRRAILRGNITHRLMQSLPDIPPGRRAEAARRHIARQKSDFSKAERDAIAGSALALLDDPRFAALFSAGSRAEVPIVGRIGDRVVNGVVDRLMVAPGAVWIADYKTNRAVPGDIAEAIKRYPGYIAQLALYRAVLAKLYPDRPIRAALVWTAVPSLTEIPPEALDAALAGLTRA